MRTAATAIAAPGTVFAGKLRVERLIGQGAMGVVYEATDITLRRRVAVKLVHPDHVGDPEKRLRFGREAYAVAGLQSQHVPHVLEINELDDGTPYLVMELLEGRTLDEVIERDGPAAVHVALDWMLQALDALAEAHRLGLVHRDIKPANLYLAQRKDRAPIVKVLDFGLVKDLRVDAVKLTVTGSTMGSPAYMAPEQVNVDQVVDARTDVWAAGITLFELLTRELPFDGQSIPSMLRQILREEPTPLRSKRSDAPPELEMIIAKCLAKDPNMRFSDAADLLRALAAVRTRLPQVTEATKTVRLPEGTVVPPGVNPMDMMDISKVRPRLMRGDPQAATAKRSLRPKTKKASSPAKQMAIAAAITTIVLTALGIVALKLLEKKDVQQTTAVPAPTPSVAPAPSTTAPATPSATPSAELVAERPKATIAFDRTIDDEQQKRWNDAAADLNACGSHPGCAKQVVVSRTTNGVVRVHASDDGCTTPPDVRACVIKVVQTKKLTSAYREATPNGASAGNARVTLTFR